MGKRLEVRCREHKPNRVPRPSVGPYPSRDRGRLNGMHSVRLPQALA
ncbi:hypothetical protein HMPREF9597_01613 [Cutibacterium acnes HL005PA4]|nr:hypothetical protein HMPREF9597_01613 [Cutibacterium acnes HL005PA4]EFT19954.1 hypothetical protein HMPREF9566_01879 [Cutibacterium acnes HL045PA1]